MRSAIIHTVSMATIAFTHALARVANNPDAQIRAQAEIAQLQRDVDLLLEEGRIKDARMERLAILELRAARAWSQAETARRLLVPPLTVASGLSGSMTRARMRSSR